MNGQDYKRLIEAGFRLLKAHIEEVNDLNVFPIPDGDTGDNMCSTMRGGVSATDGETDTSLKAVAEKSSRGMLLGARGNSGVILSQIFAGIALGFSQLEDDEADLFDVVTALEQGVKSSYKAVEKPTEGTMLTVFRESVEYAKANSAMGSGVEFVEKLIIGAEASLERTPELLDVLKEAGVVDSGGKGICYILRGVLAELKGESIDEIAAADAGVTPVNNVDFSLFTEDSDMKFGYCTEFLLRLTKAKTDIEKFDIDKFIDGLKMLGDSIVAFLTGTVVKVHIHSFAPDKILGYALGFGEFLTMKIENMTLQHNETLVSSQKYKKNAKRKKMGFVTVANGEGLVNTFSELGVDVVITGGQGNNPSLEDFLEAYDAVNAEEIFVLPNNGNILLVANASVGEYKNSKIRVVPSKSIGDGYIALATMDRDETDGDAIMEAMIENISLSVTGLVCRATRDANLNSVDIKKDDFVGFSDKEMLCDDAVRYQAALKLLEKLDISARDTLIVFYGKDVDEEEKATFEESFSGLYPNVETYTVDGGQDVFDYVFILQ